MNARASFPVLLVEDNPSEAALAFHALAQAGLTRLACRVPDGAEAVDAVLGPGPQRLGSGLKLILLDLNLREGGGLRDVRERIGRGGTLLDGRQYVRHGVR